MLEPIIESPCRSVGEKSSNKTSKSNPNRSAASSEKVLTVDSQPSKTKADGLSNKLRVYNLSTVTDNRLTRLTSTRKIFIIELLNDNQLSIYRRYLFI
jgi:hypothetical protein